MKHIHQHNHHFPVLERMALAGFMMFPPLAASFMLLSMFDKTRENLDQEETKTT